MTLEELLERIKAQNFGEKDSVIASSFMHPTKALSKAANWIKESAYHAGGLSTAEDRADNAMPWIAPSKEKQVEGGLNIAGLLQTGAFPFAPRGRGTVGSIKRPEDVFIPLRHRLFNTDYNLDPQHPMAAHVKSLIDNYLTKSLGTPNDKLVKAVDEGFNPYVEFEDRAMFMDSHAPLRSWMAILRKKDFGNLDLDLTDMPMKATASLGQIGPIVTKLLENRPLTPGEANNIKNAAFLAQQMRTLRGTPQVATSPAGRYYEDINDIALFKDATKDIKSLRKLAGDNYRSLLTPYNKSIKKHPTALIFGNKPYYIDAQDIADIIPQSNRISYLDAIRHANDAQRNAFLAKQKLTEKERLEAQLKLGRNEVLKLDNGLSWNKVDHEDALKAEGTIQGHCVGSYCDKVKQGLSEIYSLRDTNNTPILTVEIDPKNNHILQAKGRFNRGTTRAEDDFVKALHAELVKRKR